MFNRLFNEFETLLLFSWFSAVLFFTYHLHYYWRELILSTSFVIVTLAAILSIMHPVVTLFFAFIMSLFYTGDECHNLGFQEC